MNKLDDVHALFQQGAVVEFIENSEQQMIVTRRRIAKVGKSFFDYTAEFAAELNSPASFHVRGRVHLPTRVRDVIAVDSDSCTYLIDGHTVRLRVIPGTAWR